MRRQGTYQKTLVGFMYSCPRSATVAATQDAVVWVLERDVFQCAIRDAGHTGPVKAPGRVYALSRVREPHPVARLLAGSVHLAAELLLLMVPLRSKWPGKLQVEVHHLL